jgi:hypothetical protein
MAFEDVANSTVRQAIDQGRQAAETASQAIRRGSFDSVARLEQAISRFLAHWNENAKPFRWIKSATQIKRSIRNAELIYGTGH